MRYGIGTLYFSVGDLLFLVKYAEAKTDAYLLHSAPMYSGAQERSV